MLEYRLLLGSDSGHAWSRLCTTTLSNECGLPGSHNALSGGTSDCQRGVGERFGIDSVKRVEIIVALGEDSGSI